MFVSLFWNLFVPCKLVKEWTSGPVLVDQDLGVKSWKNFTTYTETDPPIAQQ